MTQDEGPHHGLPASRRAHAVRPLRPRGVHDSLRRAPEYGKGAGRSWPTNWREGLTTRAPEYSGRSPSDSIVSRANSTRATAMLSEAQVGAVLAGLGFPSEDFLEMRAAHGRILRRLADAHRAGQVAARKAGRAAARRSDQSSRTSKRATGSKSIFRLTRTPSCSSRTTAISSTSP